MTEYIGATKKAPSRINGKKLKSYIVWRGLVERTRKESEVKKKHKTYEECEMCNEWKSYENFVRWYDENYYEIDGERVALDKDILVKGNKVYSPDYCIFVPATINSLFTKCDKSRGDLPLGVYYDSNRSKYRASISCQQTKGGKAGKKNLGSFNTPEDAFKAYKAEKEKYIKIVAERYKDEIPRELYEAMYKYKVEMGD